MSDTDLQELLKKLDLFRLVTEMNTKLDVVLARQADHETRVRVLEAAVQQASGGWKTLTAISAAALAIGGLIGKYCHL